MESVFSELTRKITVFPSQLIDQNFDTIYSNLVSIERFSGGVNTKLPLPNDAPEEIPRIILKSADNQVSCLIGPQKIQIEWIPGAFNDTQSAVIFSSEILEKTIGTNSITRIGNIREYSLEVGEERGFASFIKPGSIGSLQDSLEAFSFDFTLNDSLSLEGRGTIPCNRFFRTLSATRDNDGKKLVVIMIDFNSKGSLAWGIEDFKKFILQSEDKLQYEDIAKEVIV